MEYIDDTRNGSDLRIRSSIVRVSKFLVVKVIVNDTDSKISMTQLMVQISKWLSSEYVFFWGLNGFSDNF